MTFYANRRLNLGIGGVVALAVFAFTASHADWMLREYDLLWHIKTGQLIVQNMAVPYADPFSYTHAGQPWIAKEWLAQVIFALSYAAGGWAGPLLVSTLAVALTGWLIQAQAARDFHPWCAVVPAFLAIFFTQGVTVARPHVLTFPLMVALAIILFDAARRKSAPPWWSLLLIILWTNLHGSFSIAWLIGACAFLHYLEAARFADRRVLLKWVAYCGLSGLVTLINPYLIKPHLIAANLMGGLSVMDRIPEWEPFRAPEHSVVEVGFLLLFLVLMRAGARFTFGQIIFTFAAFHAMLTHMRFLYVFFLAVPVVLLPEIAAAMPSLSAKAWQARPRDDLERFLGRNGGVIAALAVLAIVVKGAFLAGQGGLAPPEKVTISGAMAYIKAHQQDDPALQTHVYNDFNWGAPLILAGIPTFIDDRTEQLYEGPFVDDYLAGIDTAGRQAFAKTLSRPDIGWAIVPVDDPRQQGLMTLPNWKQVYADGVAAIWEKAGP